MQTHPRLFRLSDINGFWALFADNLANMIIFAGVLQGVFHVPAEIVVGRVLPGIGISLVLGLGAYAWMGWRLARREGRDDVTALPYGVSTPVMFVYLFGVMGPVYWQTGDGVTAWRVGIAAALVGGVIEAAGAVVGRTLKRVTPRAGMLGTLAGIALLWIAAVPLAEIYEHPLIGFPSLVVILAGLVAGVRLMRGVPAGLLAIVVGTGIAFAMGEARIDTTGLGLRLPIPVLGDLVVGLRLLWQEPALLAVVLPIEIYNLLETMNNVESAEAAGDRYDVRITQLLDGAGTMVGAVFGSPFPTTVYIGHPGYKRLRARLGYGLAVGIVFAVGGMAGLVGFLHALIPVAAVAPVLVFVGLVMTAQAFEATPRAHSMAVAFAMLPHVGNLLATKVQGVVTAVAGKLGQSVDLADPAWQAVLLEHGVHWVGQSTLGQGAIVSGLVWGAIVASLIDGKYRTAAGFAAAGATLTGVGLMHATRVAWAPSPLFFGYVVVAVMLAALAWRDGGVRSAVSETKTES